MKIVQAEMAVEYVLYIYTNEDHFNQYKRIDGIWEQLFGESWESVYGKKEKELEDAYAKWIANLGELENK